MKLPHWLLILCLLLSSTHAAVRLNEIAWSGTPSSSNDEWMELFNESEETVSLENWTLTSTDGTPDILLNGEIEPQGFFLLERTDDTTVPGITANQIYTGALGNTGEELVLKDAEGNIVDQTPSGEWPAGTSEPDRRSMIWGDNEWHTFDGEANEDGIFGSPGEENEPSEPSEPPPEPIVMRINEIAPYRIDGIDFIEIHIESAPNDAVLPTWNVKHNGTELFIGGGENVQGGDLITLFLRSEKISDNPDRWFNTTNSNDISTQKTWESSTKNGLNKSSGTIELNVRNEEDEMQNEDFVCWAAGELSETEQNRVNNHPDDWSGDCVDVESLIKNESIARPVGATDTNTKNDFFRHFNGSPELENEPQNAPPIPKILVQGGRRIYETSLNLTGLEDENVTIDPDGMHDLKSWKWEIDGTSCGNYETNFWEWGNVRNGTKTCEEESTRDNPGVIYFHFGAKEKFVATLTVEDYSGAQASTTINLTRDPFGLGSSTSAFDTSVKKWLTNILEKETPETEKNIAHDDQKVGNDFFDEFLSRVDVQKLNPRHQWKHPPLPPLPTLPKTMRDRIPESVRTKVAKNLGYIFLY